MYSQKAIKKIVIEQEWPKDEPKSGNEYRSLSKQIDTFLNCLNDKTAPLYWLPIDVMTNAEIAQIICSFLHRNQDNRKILSQMKHYDICYDYFNFVAQNPKNIRSMKMIYKTNLPENLDMYDHEILESINELHEIWNSDISTSAKLCKTDSYLHMIKNGIICGKDLCKEIGIGFTSMLYLEDYITVIDYTANLVLSRIIICNDNVTDKTYNLKLIDDYLGDRESKIFKYITQSRFTFKELREKFHYDEDNDNLSLYFALYMNRKSLACELDKIFSLIKYDLNDLPLPDVKIDYHRKASEYSTHQLKRILLDQPTRGFSEKLYKTQRFLERYLNEDKEDLSCIQRAFTAFYHSKSIYRKKTMPTLMRALMNDEKSSTVDAVFWLYINMKLLQSHFYLLGLKDDFFVYMNIRSKLRRLLLLPYSTWDDREAYQRIYQIGYDFLYPFAFKDTYGMTF